MRAVPRHSSRVSIIDRGHEQIHLPIAKPWTPFLHLTKQHCNCAMQWYAQGRVQHLGIVDYGNGYLAVDTPRNGLVASQCACRILHSRCRSSCPESGRLRSTSIWGLWFEFFPIQSQVGVHCAKTVLRRWNEDDIKYIRDWLNVGDTISLRGESTW